MRKKGKVLPALLCAAMVMSAAAVIPPQEVRAENDIPAYQKDNDVYATETVKVSSLPVKDEAGSLVTRPVEFTVYNSTKQEVQEVVSSENGMLPELDLVKNHNYIFFVDEEEYKMVNVYAWVQSDGRLLDIKSANPGNAYTYSEVTGFTLLKEGNDTCGRRMLLNLPVFAGNATVTQKNVRLRLISEEETLEAVSDNSTGRISVNILEDVDYMVTVDDDTYGIDAFPITMKDKSEYKNPETDRRLARYPYDHSDCHRVDEIRLVNKQDAHKNDKTITSPSGSTTVSGFNFKDILLFEQKQDRVVPELEGKNYDVIDIKGVNPHRDEVAKLAAGEFTYTEKVSGTKQASYVYYIDKNGGLQELDFRQAGDRVVFTMSSMSLYPVVIEYGDEDITAEQKILSVKVTDADQNPVSGIRLGLKGDDTVSFSTVTDAAGKAMYLCGNTEKTGSSYALGLADESQYTCDASKAVVFGADSRNETYIATVDGRAYTGNEITLTVTKKEEPKPETDNGTLSVKAVDEDGNPVEGVQLYLESIDFPGFADEYFPSETDAEGKASCPWNEDILDDYELTTAPGSAYVCDAPIEVTADGWEECFATVDGEDYYGEEVILTVRAR